MRLLTRQLRKLDTQRVCFGEMPDFDAASKALISKINKTCAVLGCGMSRLAYRSVDGKWVYKVPFNYEGLDGNDAELNRYLRSWGAADGFKLAKCRRVGKTAVIIMEYVEPVFGKDAPAWSDYLDCQQVGRNRAGEIVAFDYAQY